jgi:hypothetical protein
MYPGEDEGGRGDRPANLQTLSHSLGESRLAGAEGTGEHDQIPRPESTSQLST